MKRNVPGGGGIPPGGGGPGMPGLPPGGGGPAHSRYHNGKGKAASVAVRGGIAVRRSSAAEDTPLRDAVSMCAKSSRRSAHLAAEAQPFQLTTGARVPERASGSVTGASRTHSGQHRARKAAGKLKKLAQQKLRLQTEVYVYIFMATRAPRRIRMPGERNSFVRTGGGFAYVQNIFSRPCRVYPAKLTAMSLKKHSVITLHVQVREIPKHGGHSSKAWHCRETFHTQRSMSSHRRSSAGRGRMSP